MKLLIRSICIMFCVLSLSGCTLRRASPESAAMELDSRDRISADGKASLSFDGGNAAFTAETTDGTLTICGEYFADDEKLTIVSDQWGTMVFPYRFEKGRLVLSYEGRELLLDKKSQEQEVSGKT